jgi:arylformamidase
LQQAIQFPKAQALIIRTLPNLEEKKTKDYSGTNPPFLAPEAGEWLRTKEYTHLLVDLPSVDKEEDGGKLSVHRGFWDIPNKPRKDCTITELIWVPPHTADGLYLLNLQVSAWNTDAAPSRPVIYPMVKNQPD